MSEEIIISSVKKWLEHCVIGFNLCPFAKQVFFRKQIQYTVSKATNEEQLLLDLQQELQRLNQNKNIETTLLIHPDVLNHFYDYNDFLDLADSLIIEMKLEGSYQIASFHPEYQFAGTGVNDSENYTNRSPYPLLHLIREKSLEKAVRNSPYPELIPERNIKLMKKMGHAKLQSLFQSYFEKIKL